MNVILYRSNKGKKINGSLFYSFEYFVFLKQFVPDLKFYILNASNSDIEYFKDIFKDKYSFNLSYLEDILSIFLIEIPKLYLETVLIFCVKTYESVKDLLWNSKHVRVYSNKSHNFLNTKPNHTFYGWYDYQQFNKKTRLKFYTDIHKTFTEHKDNVLLSSVLPTKETMIEMQRYLNLDADRIYTKKHNEHNTNLFANINKIVYWHTGVPDANNRTVVEAYIHNIPLELYLHNNHNDSVYDRVETIKEQGLTPFVLSTDDILITDFLNGRNSLH
jgi:hypothetical protein